ncbi:epoxide hydrolase [Trichodelitschia bisporula]|uniref:Epoxide hydrolase n=1 Tax=Trichodelitschia bisporula TaxID=703511 RepID=A0A6G1HY19_9PEZI|nr:epoxide hydrolase [Trichodelitschia bisporula]
MAPFFPNDIFTDPRITHQSATLNGHNYHYLLGVPKEGVFSHTVFLIHGWPDISAGWRFQIPALLELGCRVVCPDLMGYGSTDAPRVPPESLSLYTFKRAADDIEELARQLGAKTIVLGGHDWGGMVVWRTVAWKPQLVTHVFSVCTAYTPPSKNYVSTADIVKKVPQFGYQLHLASPEPEARITSRNDIRQFLKGVYNGRGPSGERVFSPEKGVLFENLPKIGETRLLSEQELEYYTDQYHRNGLHGPFNWYRTREANWRDELELQTTKITIPSLFVQAQRDVVLSPALAAGMEQYVSDLTRREVDATHWALWERPEHINRILREWFTDRVLGGGQSKL